MTVGELTKILSSFPDEKRVEVEVHDSKADVRLWGRLWLAEEEGDWINLFARHGDYDV